MKRKLFCSLTIILFAVCALAQDAQYNPARIIVKFKSGTQSLREARAVAPRILGQSAYLAESAIARAGLSSTLKKSGISRLHAAKPDAGLEPLAGGMERIFIADLENGQSVEMAIAALSGRADVEYVEPDYIARATGELVNLDTPAVVPNDTNYDLQWGLKNIGQPVNLVVGKAGADINAESAWNLTTGNPGMIIAFLDTGILSTAAEFTGRLVAGYDFVNKKTDTTDDQGHGTAVTSVAAATGGNGALMAGVDWKCKIMPVKVLDNTGAGTYVDLISGINFAADNGAKIINMSESGPTASDALEDAIEYAYEKGAIIVAGMGNDNVGTLTYPAAYDKVIAVGATNSNDQRANPFTIGAPLVGSNYGDNIDFVAPGDYLIVAGFPNPAVPSLFSGTSVAAPMVSGIVSLILSIDPSLTFNQIYDILKASAIDKVGLAAEDTTGWDKYYGWGRLDAYRAVLNASAPLNIPNGGANSIPTPGKGKDTQVGYAAATVASGTAPYGVAVFSIKQNDFIVSEAGVPTSPPTTAARMFIDFRDKSVTGGVAINTGIAIVNRNSVPATITYTLHDRNAVQVTTGTGTLASGEHFSKFIDGLSEKATGFNLPADFSTAAKYQFGSLEITSTQAISILALRFSINQRGDYIVSSTPIADTAKAPASQTLFFPHIADGGLYATTIILLNTSNAAETGNLNFLQDNGSPLNVTPVGGAIKSTFPYNIPAKGVYVLQTDGSSAPGISGSVQLIPSGGTNSPVAAGVFSLRDNNGVLITEAGVPTSTPTTHALVYVDESSGHSTGFAISNPGGAPITAKLKAYKLDGTTQVGSDKDWPIAGNGHKSEMLGSNITLPANFTGVVDISSTTPFLATMLRALINSRGDLLWTTFPMADLTQPAPAPIIFPQIADGGVYATQFILLSAGGGASSTAINVYGESGDPMILVK